MASRRDPPMIPSWAAHHAIVITVAVFLILFAMTAPAWVKTHNRTIAPGDTVVIECAPLEQVEICKDELVISPHICIEE